MRASDASRRAVSAAGDGIEQHDPLPGDLFRQALGRLKFAAKFVLAAGHFGDLAGGGGAAAFPAAAILGDYGQAPPPRFAFAAQGIQHAARLAGLGAGFGGPASGVGDVLVESNAVAQFLQSGLGLVARVLGGFDRLGQAADFRFQLRQLGGAFRGGAGGARRLVLGADERLLGPRAPRRPQPAPLRAPRRRLPWRRNRRRSAGCGFRAPPRLRSPMRQGGFSAPGAGRRAKARRPMPHNRPHRHRSPRADTRHWPGLSNFCSTAP